MNILIFDIETAPKRAYVWGLWKQNIAPSSQLISDTFMLTWSAKWYGKKKVYGSKLTPDEVLNEDDSRICAELHEMLSEADAVLTHNGDKFDIPVVNSRFVLNGMTPPAPSKSIDTLKIAKKHFRFTSNRLDYLGEILGVGRKIDTGGFSLWERCMRGERKALSDMLKYNKQDVVLLEEVYDKLRPYSSTHPSHSIFKHGMVCPKCGSSHLQARGFSVTNTSKFQRFQCQDCGGWSRGRENVRDKEDMKNTLLPL